MADNSVLISKPGNVCIPKVYREEFDYKPGERVYFYELDGLLIISKQVIDNVEEVLVDEKTGE